MSTEMLTPQELISALQAGVPLVAPRAGGKRRTLSLLNQLSHLIKLEEEYRKIKAEPFMNIREYCHEQQECRGCPKFAECEDILAHGTKAWISVNERLPDDTDKPPGHGLCNVLVTYKHCGIKTVIQCMFRDGKFIPHGGREPIYPIAWMPLPMPYNSD